jgi:hypothetical protein
MEISLLYQLPPVVVIAPVLPVCGIPSMRESYRLAMLFCWDFGEKPAVAKKRFLSHDFAELQDRKPSLAVPPSKTPEEIPYAADGAQTVGFRLQKAASSGSQERVRDISRLLKAWAEPALSTAISAMTASRSMTGSRKCREPRTRSADFKVKDTAGIVLGEMDCRLTFSEGGYGADNPVRLLFEAALDGKPKSHGYAIYRGKKLPVSDSQNEPAYIRPLGDQQKPCPCGRAFALWPKLLNTMVDFVILISYFHISPWNLSLLSCLLIYPRATFQPPLTLETSQCGHKIF